MSTNAEEISKAPSAIAINAPISIESYQSQAHSTDKLEGDGLELPILGLFGEVGSLLSALKKKQRDKTDATRYRTFILEELGDALWYFSVIATRSGLKLSTLSQQISRNVSNWDEIDTSLESFVSLDQPNIEPLSDGEFSRTVFVLAGQVGNMLNDYRTGGLNSNRDKISAHLVEIFRALASTANAAQVSLNEAASENLRKTYSRWPTDFSYPPRSDINFSENEKFPSRLDFYISEIEVCKKYYVIQKCNGIIIGDRLTDNKEELDDYRFHDVFHMAFAVHLGWSPVLRALLHLKRKSIPSIDENQDGARAILIEEGVATFIFGRGRDLKLDESDLRKSVDYDLLKLVQEFIRGYEPENCELWQWERAILDGFTIFRALKKFRKGYVHLDFDNHQITFTQ